MQLLLVFLAIPCIFSAIVLLLACVAYLRRRHEPLLIEDAPPIYPRDYPIACLGCGRVHKGPCLNAAIWQEEL